MLDFKNGIDAGQLNVELSSLTGKTPTEIDQLLADDDIEFIMWSLIGISVGSRCFTGDHIQTYLSVRLQKIIDGPGEKTDQLVKALIDQAKTFANKEES